MTLHNLAQGDILRIDAVTKMKVLEVFTFMMYERDVNALERIKVDEHNK